MRPHAIALASLLIFSPISHAQTVTGQHPDRTTAQLGTASTQAGLIFNHTQGADATDCTVGGGAFEVPCWSNGTTWVALTATGASSEINDLEATDPPTILDTEIYIGTGAATGAFAAVSGDATMANTGALTIGADKILESHLKSVDAPADEEVLTYESTTGDFEWQASAGGSPGGSDTQLQYNNAGAFGGISSLTYDGTDVTLGSGQLHVPDGSVSVPSVRLAGGIGISGGVISGNSFSLSSPSGAEFFRAYYSGSTPYALVASDLGLNSYASLNLDGQTIRGYTHPNYEMMLFVPNGQIVATMSGKDNSARSEPLNVWAMATNAQLEVNGKASQSVSPFAVNVTGAGGNELEVEADGDVEISTGNLAVTAGSVTVGDILTITPKASAPATCSIGDFYVDTSGAACACSATNTWSNMHATGTCV